ARKTDLTDRLVGVVRLLDAANLRGGVRVEVAVAAPGAAERHVNVHAEVALVGPLRRRGRQQAVGRRGIAVGRGARHDGLLLRAAVGAGARQRGDERLLRNLDPADHLHALLALLLLLEQFALAADVSSVALGE